MHMAYYVMHVTECVKYFEFKSLEILKDLDVLLLHVAYIIQNIV